jgi:hypothetical protein
VINETILGASRGGINRSDGSNPANVALISAVVRLCVLRKGVDEMRRLIAGRLQRYSDSSFTHPELLS